MKVLGCLLKGVLGLVGLVLVVSIIIGIFVDTSDEKENEQAETAKDEKIEMEEDTVRKEAIADAKRKIDKLKPEFNSWHDEFEDLTFYRHKRFDKDHWPSRTTLIATCNNKGFQYLSSNYYGDDWIFHNQIIMVAEDTKLASNVVPRSNQNNYDDIDNYGNVYEHIDFLDSLPLLLSLNANLDRQVKIRLKGERNYDFDLNKKDHIAIAKTYQFASSVKFLRENDIDYLK